MTTRFLDLGAAHDELGPELEAAVTAVTRSGWYLLWPELEAFEREFAAECGVGHCVGVGSGMSAIELALRAAGVGPGDEVIVPAYTWVATWLAVTAAGARPVGVDVVGSTYNLDPGQLAAAHGPRTAAIVPVHLRGEPAAMEPVLDFARAHGLFVVEDAAQAHGAKLGGRPVGGLGDAAAFSFYPTKNLGALGDGGAVTTDDAGLADRLRLLRNYGTRDRYEIELAGVNSRLSELAAAVLRVKLPRLADWNRRRARLAASYAEALAGAEAIALPTPIAAADPAWHLYVIGHPDRDAAAAALAAAGVETLIHYPVLPHRAPPYAAEWPAGSFPVAERLAADALSLPLHPHLDPAAPARIAGELLATV